MSNDWNRQKKNAAPPCPPCFTAPPTFRVGGWVQTRVLGAPGQVPALFGRVFNPNTIWQRKIIHARVIHGKVKHLCGNVRCQLVFMLNIRLDEIEHTLELGWVLDASSPFRVIRSTASS